MKAENHLLSKKSKATSSLSIQQSENLTPQTFSGAKKTSGTTTETQHMYLTQKLSLSLLSNTAINFLIILFLSLLYLPFASSSQNFTFNSPESAVLSSPFQVSLDLSTPDSKIYDVKVYAEDPSSSPKTISEIFDGSSWQNSYFYLKGVFPAQKTFDIRINKEGSWQLCARLKNSTTLAPVCNLITITSNSSAQHPIIIPKENETEEENLSNLPEIKENPSNSQSSSNIQALSLSSSLKDSVQDTKINSSPIILKSEETSSSFITKQGYLRIALGISFALLLLIISILLALKQ